LPPLHVKKDDGMPITIEDASIRHLDKLYEIETQCFDREAFTKQQIASLLRDYNSVSLVAKINGEIMGFIIGTIYIERNSLTGHILTIDISPVHRRKGTAQKLLQETEKIFKEKGVKTCRLEVREDNIAALRLYQKFGYKKVAKLNNYYGNAHGIYLKKDLT
jgi:ribosomal-protein-alanine N-acetyltransferase